MEEFEKKNNQQEKEELFSRSVKAGKRTYFFDVKTTKKDDYYLTITERKKKFDEKGKLHVEKHKVFLYKEDFDKFFEALEESINHIQSKVSLEGQSIDKTTEQFTDVDFDDLEKS